MDGEHEVIYIAGPNQFSISGIITSPGSTGQVIRVPKHSIILNPSTSVNLTENKPMYFGTNSYISGSDTSGLNLNTLHDINVTATNINLPLNTGITFSNDFNKIYQDNTGMNIDAPILNLNSTDVYINSDLTVTDPVITVGESNLIQDRGIDFLWKDSTDNLNYKTICIYSTSINN